jgi:urease accessory protein
MGTIMAWTTTPIIITAIAVTIILMATLMLMITGSRIDGTDTAPGVLAPGSGELDEAAALYRLMTWLSPSFPVGAFSYSSGIEWAVEAGDINNAATLQDWLASMLGDGSGFCDGVFLTNAYRAVALADEMALSDVAELAAAFVSSRERLLETMSQGRAFMEIARAAWTSESLEQVMANCSRPIAYPVAVGILSAAHGIPLMPTLHAFLHALVSNWISAGARLIPLGQTDSQRVLAALEPAVVATGAKAIAATLDDLGSATFRADLASMRHETQYTRLFRS